MNAIWNSVIGKIDPDASTLKYLLKDRWIRFHSLPESKRYAAHESERSIILYRHNIILDELWKNGSEIIIINTKWSESKKADEKLKTLGNYWESTIVDPKDAESPWRHMYYKKTNWSVGKLDNKILQTANDEISNFMVINMESKSLYHPYDGGMDLIISDKSILEHMKYKFIEFLSEHPEGL